jgi:hypothetical protein
LDKTRGREARERGEGKVRVRVRVRVRDTTTTTTKFRITTTPNYLPMESTTHTTKKIFFIQYNVQFLSSPHKK